MVVGTRTRLWLSTAALFGTGRAALFDFFAPPDTLWPGLLGDATPRVGLAALVTAGGAVLAARVAGDSRLRRAVAVAASVMAVPMLVRAVEALPNIYLTVGFVVGMVGLAGLALALWQPAHDVRPWPAPEPFDAANSWGLIASIPLFFMIVVVASGGDPLAVALAVVAFLFAATITLLAYNATTRPALRDRLAGPAVAGGLAFGLVALFPLGEPDGRSRMVGLMLLAGAVGMAGLGISLRRYRAVVA